MKANAGKFHFKCLHGKNVNVHWTNVVVAVAVAAAIAGVVCRLQRVAARQTQRHFLVKVSDACGWIGAWVGLRFGLGFGFGIEFLFMWIRYGTYTACAASNQPQAAANSIDEQ